MATLKENYEMILILDMEEEFPLEVYGVNVQLNNISKLAM